MKFPKYLNMPCLSWQEKYGLKRAIRVLEIQAFFHRKAGEEEKSNALLEVAKAFKKTIKKENPTAEAVTLNWGEK